MLPFAAARCFVSGEKLVDVAEAQAEDVERAVQAARKAFDEGPWPRMTGEQRGRVLLRLADLVEVSERRGGGVFKWGVQGAGGDVLS